MTRIPGLPVMVGGNCRPVAPKKEREPDNVRKGRDLLERLTGQRWLKLAKPQRRRGT